MDRAMNLPSFCYAPTESFQTGPWTVTAVASSAVSWRRSPFGLEAPMRARRPVAVAFAGAVALTLGLVWMQLRPPADPLSTLARAVGERRFIEPRLTGGFAYAPCSPLSEGRSITRVLCSKPPTFGSPAGKELRAALRSVQGEADPSGAEAFHLKGVADLLGGQDEGSVSRAVTALEEALRKAPENAQIRADLAASLFVLAHERDEPALLVRALAAASEAVRLDPSLREARFNRALILDRLFLIDGARRAWGDFLRLDRTSGWADEARQHQSALAEPQPPVRWAQSLPSLREAALRGDGAKVRELVRLSPQAAREYAAEDLLGDWGDLVPGQPVAAEVPLTVARSIGQALRSETGEPVVAEAVAVIDRSSGRPVLPVLAAGHRSYRDGQRAYRDQLPGKAAPLLTEAREGFNRAESPLGSWALLSLAGIDLNSSRYGDALEKYDAVRTTASRSGSLALAGCADWGTGLVHFRDSRFSESLSHFLSASEAFETARERQNLGAVLELVSENLRFLGQGAAAWKSRYQAAEVLAPFRDSIRLHNLLWEGGWATVEDGESRAGLDFLNEGVGLDERYRRPQRLAESLLWRSKVHLSLEDGVQALKDLLRAEKENLGTSDDAVRERLAADLDYVEGEVRRRFDPKTALQPLVRAVDFYQKKGLFLDLPGAYLARFRAEMAGGRIDEAHSNIEAALGLFERSLSSLKDPSLRLSTAEKAQGLYDEMLLLQADREGGEAALETVERARALEASSSSVPLAEKLAALPRNLAVLEYARAGDRLFIWLIHEGRVESSSLTDHHLEEKVRAFLTAIIQRDASLDAKAKELHRLLIPSGLSTLPAETELLIIPDKALNTLPFAALKDPATGRYLVEDRALRIAPSLALRGESGAVVAGPRTALLVAGTQFDVQAFPTLQSLPGAAQEVSDLKGLYREPRVLSGADATKAHLLAELDDQEVFHFAGHAVFNSRHPDHSYFVLAPAQNPADEGVLFLHEIAGRRFNHLRLVVLSACSTVGPLDTRTGGVSGLARPFLDAGAEAVVGALWNARDEAAAQMLPDFHRRYLASGNAADALRRAQLAMLQSADPLKKNPDAWAVFQVITAR
jgi:CHAT domain-containing protein